MVNKKRLSTKQSLKLLKEAEKILTKEEDLTSKDRNRFYSIGRKINKEHEIEYIWLCEGMYLR